MKYISHPLECMCLKKAPDYVYPAQTASIVSTLGCNICGCFDYQGLCKLHCDRKLENRYSLREDIQFVMLSSQSESKLLMVLPN